MKKYALLLLGTLVLTTGTAFGKISDDRIALGGIAIGCSEEYVREVYGPPKTVGREFYAPRGQYIREYQYGDSFSLSFLEDGTVFRMMSMELPNGIATPDGICVGSSYTDILTRYGEPDLRQIDGEVDHFWYFGEGESGNLVFHVSYGKVIGIVCGKK